MSAFIVSPATMDRWLSGVRDYARITRRNPLDWWGLPDTPESYTEVGRQLYALNQIAVRDRYGTVDPVPLYRFRPLVLGRIVAVKAGDSLRYQCSEGSAMADPRYRWLSEWVDRLALWALRSLPEWERAPWD